MRARDEIRTSALRMLKAAIHNYDISRTDPKSSRFGEPVSEGDLVGIVEREIKQRHDSIEAFRKGSRDELAAREEAEIRILSGYLPTQLSREAIVAHVQGIVDEVGREFKVVMPRAARELKGQADGRQVNEVVRELTA